MSAQFEDDPILAEMDAIDRGRGLIPQSEQLADSEHDPILAEMNKIDADRNRSDVRFAGETLVKAGPLRALDFVPDLLRKAVRGADVEQAADRMMANRRAREEGLPMPGSKTGIFGSEEEVQKAYGENPEWKPSTAIKEALLERGINIDSEPEDTAGRQIAGATLRGITEAVFAPSRAETVGKTVSNLAKNAALTGSWGAGSGVIQQAGVHPVVADLLSAILMKQAPKAISKTGTAIKDAARVVHENTLEPAWQGLKRFGSNTRASHLTPEKQVSEYVFREIGQENLPAVMDKLKNSQSPIPGYKRTVAEITENPTLAALEKEYGSHGELAATKEKNSEVLADYIKEQARGKTAATAGDRVQSGIQREAANLRQQRREPTFRRYEELESRTDPVSIGPVKLFFSKNRNQVGDLEKDVNYVRGLVEPRGTLTREEIQYAADYNRKIKEMKDKNFGQRAIDQFLKEFPKPKTLQPTVGQLHSARTNINAKIRYYDKRGDIERSKLMKEALKAVDKSLINYPEHKEVTELYRQGSKELNQLEEQKTIAKILDGKINQEKIIETIITGKPGNTKHIKELIGDKNKILGNLRDGAMDLIWERTTDLSDNGGRVLNDKKFLSFMRNENNLENMRTVLSPEQMKALFRVRQEVLARQRTAKLAQQRGNVNAQREFDYQARTGLKKLLPGLLSKHSWTKGMFEAGFEKAAQQAVSEKDAILGNFLHDPRYATKVITNPAKKGQKPLKKAHGGYVEHPAIREYLARNNNEDLD